MKMSRQFPLNALRVFEATARHLGFTKAGDELGMTQTAVSYQIKLLEENIGEALFVRRPRQITLTETGERLYPKVAEAFSLLGDAVQSARRSADETLEIHAIPTFASKWLAKNLGDFQLRNPGIAVRLLRIPESSCVIKDGADISIMEAANAPSKDFTCHPLLTMNFAPMLGPALAAKMGGVNHPEDLLNFPLINARDDFWEKWFKAAGVNGLPQANSNLSAVGVQDLEASAAIAGQGVAMLSPFLFQDELVSGRLIQPFDITLPGASAISLVYPQARRNAGKIKAFQSWITEALKETSAPQNPISGA